MKRRIVSHGLFFNRYELRHAVVNDRHVVDLAVHEIPRFTGTRRDEASGGPVLEMQALDPLCSDLNVHSYRTMFALSAAAVGVPLDRVEPLMTYDPDAPSASAALRNYVAMRRALKPA